MDEIELSRQAVREVQSLLGRTTCSERAALEAFLEEFEGLLFGWRMRLEELAKDADDEGL